MQNSLPDLIVTPEVPVRNPKERGLKVLQFTPRHSQSRAYALSAASQLPLLINGRSLRPLRARHLFVQARHLPGSGGRVNCNSKNSVLAGKLFHLVKNHVVFYLDVGSLHPGGTGFDDAGAFKFPQGVHDHGTCDPGAVGDLARNKDALRASKLLKNMDDGLGFRIGKRSDGGLDHRQLSALLRALLADRTQHFQAHHGGAVLAEDDIVDPVALRHPVDKESAQALPRDLNGGDDGGKVLRVRGLKAQRGQIYVFLRGKDGKQALI